LKKLHKAKKLTLRKETLSELRHVTGGDIISYNQYTIPIDDTVDHGPAVTVGCSVGCPIQA
jgi:hypothetical protein